jgi:hypothetical protein
MVNDTNLSSQLFLLPSFLRKEVEAWVVNSVKVNLIKKLDNLLEKEGRINSRQLFLVPIFTIAEMVERVEHNAPEMKTCFFKELNKMMEQVEKKFARIVLSL